VSLFTLITREDGDSPCDNQLLYADKCMSDGLSVRRVIIIGYPFSLQPLIAVLEPKLHTPAFTLFRCPFLFTVSSSPLTASLDDAHSNYMLHIVCTIALRYSNKPEVYPIAMRFAQSAASSPLIGGTKSVELCQAYILMSFYDVPARRWDVDCSWLYAGLAIRCASFSHSGV
jgi:hypothetical protein